MLANGMTRMGVIALSYGQRQVLAALPSGKITLYKGAWGSVVVKALRY